MVETYVSLLALSTFMVVSAHYKSLLLLLLLLLFIHIWPWMAAQQSILWNVSNCFCPSWRCLRCMMAFAGAFTTKQPFIHPHCTNSKLGRRQFWHDLQKLLLSSHPRPNMNDQCTIWKKNTENNFMMFLFNFKRFRIEFRFLFFFNSHCRGTTWLQIDGSIYDKKYPNPKKLLQKVFQRFSVVFDVLNNILKI